MHGLTPTHLWRKGWAPLPVVCAIFGHVSETLHSCDVTGDRQVALAWGTKAAVCKVKPGDCGAKPGVPRHANELRARAHAGGGLNPTAKVRRVSPCALAMRATTLTPLRSYARPTVCPPVRASDRPSARRPVRPTVRASAHPPVPPTVHTPIRPSAHPTVRLSARPEIGSGVTAPRPPRGRHCVLRDPAALWAAWRRAPSQEPPGKASPSALRHFGQRFSEASSFCRRKTERWAPGVDEAYWRKRWARIWF